MMLSDEEIIQIAADTKTGEPGLHGYILPISFAREIERAVLAKASQQVQDRAVPAQAAAIPEGWSVYEQNGYIYVRNFQRDGYCRFSTNSDDNDELVDFLRLLSAAPKPE
jgi:hypothetical protein